MSDHRDNPARHEAVGRLQPGAALRHGGRLHRAFIAAAAPLGLVHPIESLFGIDRVLPDDTFVASYPRSGNTWTRYILAYLLRGTDVPLDPHTVNGIAPDAYVSPQAINARRGKRFIKIHEPWLGHCPRVIYVHRDCREAIVSYWHFVRRSERYAGTFSEFLRSRIPARHGSWKRHMLAMQQRTAADPATIHVIRYDDLTGRFRDTVARLAQWAGIGHGVDLDAVERLTSPEALEAGERHGGGTAFLKDFGVSFYIDRGKGADWRACWSAADLAWLTRDRQLAAIMEEFGYR